MRWPTAMLLAALGTAGCRNPQPTFDPFFPRTRIPPPSTGAATGAPDAFYTSPTPPLTGSAPAYSPSASGAPAAGGSSGFYSPPGGFQYQQPSPTPAPGASGYMPTPGPVSPRSTSVARPADSITSARYEEPADEPANQSARVSRANYVRTVDNQPSAVYERGGQTGANSSTSALAADDSSSDTIDIMDLPPVKRSRGQVE